MAVKISKLFTVTGGMSDKPVTILVTALKPPGKETVVLVDSLEGIYDSREEFEDALDYTVKVWKKGSAREGDEIKKWKSIYLKIPGAQKLVYMLKEVLEASEEG